MRGKSWLFILLILINIFGFFLLNHYYKNREIISEKIKLEKRKINWKNLEDKINKEIKRFNKEVSIYIKDLDKNWIISIEKEKLFPAASLAKIPIMATCFLLENEKKLDLEQTIKLKSQDKLGGSGILKIVLDNSEFPIRRLIGLMIYESDNTATNIITNIIGINNLNNYFKKIGLKNTYLLRKVADYSSRRNGKENYTTAEDMGNLLERFYRKNFINEKISDECIEILKLQRINDRIPKYLPASVLVAHKTGLERNICHDVGIVFTKKGDFIICVLTKNGNLKSSKEFIAKISLLVYNYFKNL